MGGCGRWLRVPVCPCVITRRSLAVSPPACVLQAGRLVLTALERQRETAAKGEGPHHRTRGHSQTSASGSQRSDGARPAQSTVPECGLPPPPLLAFFLVVLSGCSRSAPNAIARGARRPTREGSSIEQRRDTSSRRIAPGAANAPASTAAHRPPPRRCIASSRRLSELPFAASLSSSSSACPTTS
jgi:hypothetical protein